MHEATRASWLSGPDLALAARVSGRAAVRFLRQRAIKAFRGVVLERTQTGECLVDVALLRLELADAVGDPLEPEPVLGGAGRIGFVEAQILADVSDRESEPPQFLDQDEAGSIPVIENAGPADPRRRDEPSFLVEANALSRQRELSRQLGDAVAKAVDSLERATRFMLNALEGDAVDEALAGASPYLRLFAMAQGGTLLGESALASHRAMKAGDNDHAHAGRIRVCRFFAENIAPIAPGLEDMVVGGAASVNDAPLTLVD